MAALITLDEAKEHLRITTTAQDADIQQKADEASAIVIDYLKTEEAWDPTTVPLPVKAAVKLTLAHLWEHRGDDMASDEALWAALRRVLERFRDPTLA
jgi:hypothetical protein